MNELTPEQLSDAVLTLRGIRGFPRNTQTAAEVGILLGEQCSNQQEIDAVLDASRSFDLWPGMASFAQRVRAVLRAHREPTAPYQPMYPEAARALAEAERRWISLSDAERAPFIAARIESLHRNPGWNPGFPKPYSQYTPNETRHQAIHLCILDLAEQIWTGNDGFQLEPPAPEPRRPRNARRSPVDRSSTPAPGAPE